MDLTIDRPGRLIRFWQYCEERFPPFQHGLLIAVFTFSAASYSRILRGVEGILPWQQLLPGIGVVFCIFFLLRLFDEFKDKEEDKKYRPHLPVPRGLVSLAEIRIWIVLTFVLLFALLIIFLPTMWLFVMVTLAYLILMRVEFFVPEWLKERPLLYMTSHMFILPLTDWFATGLDWHTVGESLPVGLGYFLMLSYCNGMVIEIGRKIRPEHEDEPGQRTYSSIYGSKKATRMWMLMLVLTFVFALLACLQVGYGLAGTSALLFIFSATIFTGFKFLNLQNLENAQLIEKASGIWTLGMYLILGAFPMLINQL